MTADDPTCDVPTIPSQEVPELKACPFCGAEAKLTEDQIGDAWSILCLCPMHPHAYDDTREEVIAKWNRRAGPSVSQPLPEAAPHPESTCEKCGRENVTWFAPSPLWNDAVRTPQGPDYHDWMLCPVCFIKLAEQHGVSTTAWRVFPEEYNGPDDDSRIHAKAASPLCECEHVDFEHIHNPLGTCTGWTAGQVGRCPCREYRPVPAPKNPSTSDQHPDCKEACAHGFRYRDCQPCAKVCPSAVSGETAPTHAAHCKLMRIDDESDLCTCGLRERLAGETAAPATPTTEPTSILTALARPRDWSEDFAHENGQYMNHCHICQCTFFGHKRRVTCKSCSKAGGSPSVEEDSEPRFSGRKCNDCGGDIELEGSFTHCRKCVVRRDTEHAGHPAGEGAPTDADDVIREVTASTEKVTAALYLELPEAVANDVQRRIREDVARLASSLRSARDQWENAAKAHDGIVRLWEEAEGRCCPEDVGFEEYIGALTRRAEAAEADWQAALSRVEELERASDAQTEREAAVCPEDVGFEEYIPVLERRLAETEGNLKGLDKDYGKLLAEFNEVSAENARRLSRIGELRGAFLKLREEVANLSHALTCPRNPCDCNISRVLSLLDRATTTQEPSRDA